MVRFAAVTFDVRATVPAIVSVAKDWVAPIAMVWLVPVKVTEEPVDVNVVTDDESHDPAMAIEVESKTRIAEPVDVTLPLKVTVVPVRLSAPDHVTFEEKVVLTPGTTVRLKIGCVIRMEPPDALTTRVEVPAVKAPAEVSIDRIVMVLLPAVSAPPPATSKLAPPVMSFPDVVRVPLMERFPSTSVALFCVTVPETVRLWNPFEASRVPRVLAAPDRVTVLEPFVNVAPTPDVSQLPLTVQAPLVSVMVPEVLPFTVPSAQFGEVLLFVHDPPNVHVALPILRYAAALEMDVFPAMFTKEGAPDPSRRADPERVNPPIAVSPVPADAPIVSVPAAWVIA